jgi:hypothetical protein
MITKFCTVGFKTFLPGTELALCHPSGIHNFDGPLIFLEHLCTPVLDHKMSRLKDSVCFVSAQGTRDEISI